MPKVRNEPLTFEKVWAALMENREQIKETSEQIKETERIMKETIKDTNNIVGKLGNSFGELAEHLVRPGIVEKFNTIGFHFNDTYKEREVTDPKTGKFLAEVDIVLENGDFVIAVEVKAKLKYEDVDDHLARMEVLRSIADSRGDKRKYRGAIAGAVATKETCAYAIKAGFYVIVQSGDTMKLDLPEGFKPREW